MSDWQPIESVEQLENYPGDIVVGWWFEAPGLGRSWEISDDWMTECATHFTPLPAPPENSHA